MGTYWSFFYFFTTIKYVTAWHYGLRDGFLTCAKLVPFTIGTVPLNSCFQSDGFSSNFETFTFNKTDRNRIFSHNLGDEVCHLGVHPHQDSAGDLFQFGRGFCRCSYLPLVCFAFTLYFTQMDHSSSAVSADNFVLLQLLARSDTPQTTTDREEKTN